MPKNIPYNPRNLNTPLGTCIGCGKPSNLAFCEACLPSDRTTSRKIGSKRADDDLNGNGNRCEGGTPSSRINSKNKITAFTGGDR